MDPSLIAVVGFLCIAVLIWLRFGRGGGIDPAALQSALEEGSSILDVRTPGEFSSGHVKNAVNIPVNELGLRLKELGKPGTAPIIVYCASGMRSRRARSILETGGWTVLDAGRLGAFPDSMRE